MAARVPVVTSASGMKMPIVGLGTLRIPEVEETIDLALEAGYRHFDTAFLYDNETAIGKALKKWLDSGKIKREELFITTKLPMIAMKDCLVEEYLKGSLDRLQLPYVDLYLIHKPVGFQPGNVNFPVDEKGYVKLDMTTDHVAIWKAMEAQVDAGRTKFIGLSDFNVAQVERIVKVARIKPATVQLECHLYFQRKDLREFGKKNGIPLTAYCCLGSAQAVPLFNTSGWMTETHLKSPLTDDVVVRIAKAHNKTPGQVLLKHLTQLGTAVIPKSSSLQRLKQNIQLFDFELTDAEMAELNVLDLGEEGRKFNLAKDLFKGYEKHPECPYPQN